MLLVAVLAALALLAWFAAATRTRLAVAATAAGLAAAVAALAGVLNAVQPVELVSVPLAFALLGIGTLQLGREERARSWPWLGPGILALLVPSLLAIDGAGEPLWRAIALGAVAALVFVLALQRRLQAPFVLGGTVLLTHLLVQSWPLLEQVGRAVEWWIWLGLAGIVVVLLAARYERRVQNVRAVARRIADLR
ncbi:MAG: SCO7613 C-terminal domain-containing membrane protein [Microcella pacifica]